MFCRDFRSSENSWKEIKGQAWKRLDFIVIKINCPWRKQEHSVPRYNNERNEAKESNETEGVYGLKLFWHISDTKFQVWYKAWGFKGLQKLG